VAALSRVGYPLKPASGLRDVPPLGACASFLIVSFQN